MLPIALLILGPFIYAVYYVPLELFSFPRSKWVPPFLWISVTPALVHMAARIFFPLTADTRFSGVSVEDVTSWRQWRWSPLKGLSYFWLGILPFPGIFLVLAIWLVLILPVAVFLLSPFSILIVTVVMGVWSGQAIVMVFQEANSMMLRAILWAMFPFFSPRASVARSDRRAGAAAGESLDEYLISTAGRVMSGKFMGTVTRLAPLAVLIFVIFEVILPIVDTFSDFAYTATLFQVHSRIIEDEPLIADMYGERLVISARISLLASLISAVILIFSVIPILIHFFRVFMAGELTWASLVEFSIQKTNLGPLFLSNGGDGEDETAAGEARDAEGGQATSLFELFSSWVELGVSLVDDLLQILIACSTVAFLEAITFSWIFKMIFGILGLSYRFSKVVSTHMYGQVVVGRARLVMRLFLFLTLLVLALVPIVLAILGVLGDFCSLGWSLTPSTIASYERCQHIGVPLNLTSLAGVRELNFDSLKSYSGLIVISDNPDLVLVSFASLTTINSVINAGGGGLWMARNPLLQSLSFPALEQVAGEAESPALVSVSSNPSLLSVTFPALEEVSGDSDNWSSQIIFENNTVLLSISFPALSRQSPWFLEETSLFRVSKNPGLTELALPEILEMGRLVVEDCESLFVWVCNAEKIFAIELSQLASLRTIVFPKVIQVAPSSTSFHLLLTDLPQLVGTFFPLLDSQNSRSLGVWNCGKLERISFRDITYSQPAAQKLGPGFVPGNVSFSFSPDLPPRPYNTCQNPLLSGLPFDPAAGVVVTLDPVYPFALPRNFTFFNTTFASAFLDEDGCLRFGSYDSGLYSPGACVGNIGWYFPNMPTLQITEDTVVASFVDSQNPMNWGKQNSFQIVLDLDTSSVTLHLLLDPRSTANLVGLVAEEVDEAGPSLLLANSLSCV